jgi:hypothetical protein
LISPWGITTRAETLVGKRLHPCGVEHPLTWASIFSASIARFFAAGTHPQPPAKLAPAQLIDNDGFEQTDRFAIEPAPEGHGVAAVP